MAQRIDVHLHIHEGASAEAVAAAVRAAIDSGGGTMAAIESVDDGITAERRREYWRRSYTESQNDAEGKARPLLKFLAENPGRLIPYPEVSDALGFANARSLPGLLGAFGRRVEHRYSGEWPFERTWTDGQWHLRMSAEAADVIKPLF